MGPFAYLLPATVGGTVSVPSWLFYASSVALIFGSGLLVGLGLGQARVARYKEAMRLRDERIVSLQVKASRGASSPALKSAPAWGDDPVAEDDQTVHLSWQGKAGRRVSPPED